MKRLLPLIIIFTITFLLYHPTLSIYFSQDDFFHFTVSQTDGSLRQFFNLFGFHSFEERGIAFYRPIFREGLYNVFYSIFGLNHLPFRVLSLIIHLINIGLVYILMQKIFKKQKLSLFVSFFFAITASNVALLYYLAGGIQALGITMFLILSLVFYIDYLKNRDSKFKVFSFLTFLLALGSHELALVIPLLLTGLVFVYMPRKMLANIWQLWPFFVVTVLYLYLEITKIGFPQTEQQYRIVFDIKTILNSLAWYSGWAIGLPEMLIDFVLPGFKLNPTLMRYWGDYFKIIFPTFFVAMIILASATVYILLREKEGFKQKKFWFLIFWFPVALAPVIFLPFHKSTYYLAPALPGFWGAMGFLILNTYWDIKEKQPKLAMGMMSFLIGVLFLLSATSISLGNTTFWAATRGRLAEKLINQVASIYPTLPKGSAVYFTNDPNYPFVADEWGGSSKQAAFVLNGNDALRLLYKDPTLKVFYEDLGGIPQDFPEDKVYSLTVYLQQ